MKSFSLGSMIFMMSLSSVITGLLFFTALRDSCFSASYASAFPGECYKK